MTDAKARLLQMIADEPHMGGGGLLKAVTKAQKMSKAAQPIVSAAEHEANLARLLEPSKATMRLYHGTTATEGGKGTEAIRRFKPSKEGALGSGVYLTPSPAHASGYSGIPNDEALELMLGNPSHQSTGMKALNQRNSGNVLPSQQGGNMLPVYAQIKNPLIIEGTHSDPMIEALTKLGMDEAQAAKMVERAYDTKGYIGKEVESRARAQGYDGLMQYRYGELGEVVSYNPNAIKSATGNRGTFDINDPDLSKATGGAVHMAGGGRTPKYPWERYPQPKKVAEMRAREINPVAGAVKKGADYATQLIDKGPSFSSLVGNLVGAVPFVGPDLRKRMESSDISIPTDITMPSFMPEYMSEQGTPVYKQAGIEMGKIPAKDLMEVFKVSDFTPFAGMSNVAESIGYGQMPDPLDLLDAAGVAALGYGAIKGGVKAGSAAAGAAKKATQALTPSKITPLETGATYATKQEGPFFRVSPTALDTSKATTRGIKEADGLRGSALDGGGAEQAGREVPKFLSSEEVGRIIADPVANEPLNIAKKYTRDTQGTDFGVPQVPSSSLAKQSGIARIFDLAVQGSPEYKSAIFGAYGREMPELMERIGAKNYDDLMEKAYRQMAKETDDQFKRLPYNFSYHRAGEGNYNGAKDMASDVHGNKHLYVYQGGDKHDFLHNVDPQSGLNENEKFRAVHDLLGHAIYGNEFGPKGEEMAWAVHQQMYSPLARMAMTAETRGQNSVVNYSPLNAKLKQTISEYERLGNEARRRGDKALVNKIAELKRQAYSGLEFAPNRAVLLPPEFMNPQFAGGIPEYLAAANKPMPGTSIQSPLTHFSNEPGLTFTDPRMYGTGIKGAEAERLMNYPGAVRDRSYFYMGEPGSVLPEPGLGVNRYRGESSNLYDITQDPLNFNVLARESNRTPYTAKYNQGITYPTQDANDIERLVREYGYEGMANPKASKPMAIMFNKTPVQRRKKGGEVHMAGGGLLKAISKAQKTAKAVKDAETAMQTFTDIATPVIRSGTRKFDVPAAKTSVIKEPGGNWLSGSVEQAMKPLRKKTAVGSEPSEVLNELTNKYTPEAMSRLSPNLQDFVNESITEVKQGSAINDWIDRNLTNYVKKQMATPGDPVRKLAEEGISHMPELDIPNRSVPESLAVLRMNAGQAPLGVGKSNAAKGWETATDYRLNVAPAKEYTKPLTESEIRRGFSSAVNTDPWLTKLDPDTPVFHAADADSFARGLGFDHIVDVLNQDLAAGRIRPEQLNKISMEQAVRRTYEFDQEMAKKMRETQAKVTEGMPVHKDYSDKGYKWIELKAPDYNSLPLEERKQMIARLTEEAKQKGLTPEDYIERYPESQLAEALKYEGDTMGHCVGGYCPDVLEGRSRIFSLRDAKGEPHVTVEVEPNQNPYPVSGEAFTRLSPQEKAQYREYVRQWRQRNPDVEELTDEHTAQALKEAGVAPQPDRIVQIKGKQNRAPKEDYLPFVQDFVKGGQWSDVGDLRNTGLRKVEGQYMTEPEHDDWLLNQLQPPEEGMAEGGEVKSFFEEKSAKQRLLDMIAEEPHMAGGGLLKAIGKAQKTTKKAQMFSAVDKALEASKRGAGTGMEFANELAKTSGIKKAELVDRGIMVPSKNGPVLNPALTQLPKMSKQDFVSHLNEKYKPPGVRKITLGEQNLTHEAIDKKAMQMMADDVGDFVDRNGDITYEDAFNYSYDHDYDKYYERAKDELSEESGTKYSKYKMPGAENYRESLYQYENPKGTAFTASHWDDPNILYHMRQTDRVTPTYNSAQIDAIGQRMADAMGTKVENLGSGAPEMMIRQGVISPLEAAQFAHAKDFRNMDIDMSPAQKRALHIEEIQSDWHQKGRDKGYVNMFDKPYTIEQDVNGMYRVKDASGNTFEPYLDGERMSAFLTAESAENAMKGNMGRLPQPVGMPDAPFKKNWHEHALKQALMDAAEGGYDQLLITPGAEQAKRFDLSQQIDTVEWNTDTGRLYAKEKETGDYRKIADNVTSDNIADYVGKETAKKLMEQPTSHSYKQLSGLDLQVGGEGMAGFYDKMVPSYLNDIGKKYGVRVGEHAIEGDVPYSKTTPTLADVQRLAQEMYGVSDIQAISALPVEQRNAINQAFADRVRAEHATKLHSFDITPEMREDILNNGLPMYQRGGEVHMGIGGAALKARKVAEAAKAAKKAAEVAPYLPGVHYADPLAPPTMKMSEALGNVGAEGKTLNFTETDRSRVFGPNRGGAGFAGLQHYSLPHKEANTVWGFGSKGITEKKINQNDPENTIWTTYAGSPTQHKSNTVVVKDALGQLQSANLSGAVHPKQIEFINDRIRGSLSKNGKPLFPSDFDITDPKAFDFATTFDRRAAISDALMGIGVKKPMISKEFKAANPGVKWQDAANIEAILQRETDPAMMGANTNDVGPNLFVMDNGIIHRPDLNEAFPYQVTGNDLGMRYELTPFRDAAPDWIQARGIKPNEPINAWAMSRAVPSQFVSDKYLTGLQKKGRKEGGLAQIKKVKRHGNTVSN